MGGEERTKIVISSDGGVDLESVHDGYHMGTSSDAVFWDESERSESESLAGGDQERTLILRLG